MQKTRSLLFTIKFGGNVDVSQQRVETTRCSDRFSYWNSAMWRHRVVDRMTANGQEDAKRKQSLFLVQNASFFISMRGQDA